MVGYNIYFYKRFKDFKRLPSATRQNVKYFKYIFESLYLHKRLCFYYQILLIYKCGFIKSQSEHRCLFAMSEKGKTSNDKGKALGALLTDLSKSFDCLSHELILAKLHAYGFSKPYVDRAFFDITKSGRGGWNPPPTPLGNHTSCYAKNLKLGQLLESYYSGSHTKI